jgi:hypothetical protein
MTNNPTPTTPPPGGQVQPGEGVAVQLYPRYGLVGPEGPALVRHIVGDRSVALCGRYLAVIDLDVCHVIEIERVCGECCDRYVRRQSLAGHEEVCR